MSPQHGCALAGYSIWRGQRVGWSQPLLTLPRGKLQESAIKMHGSDPGRPCAQVLLPFNQPMQIEGMGRGQEIAAEPARQTSSIVVGTLCAEASMLAPAH